MVTHDEALARRTGRHIVLLDGRIVGGAAPSNGDAGLLVAAGIGGRHA